MIVSLALKEKFTISPTRVEQVCEYGILIMFKKGRVFLEFIMFICLYFRKCNFKSCVYNYLLNFGTNVIIITGIDNIFF